MIEEYKKNGYFIIRNAYTKEEILNLRKICHEEFKNLNADGDLEKNRQIFSESFIRKPELINPLFKKNIIDQIKIKYR